MEQKQQYARWKAADGAKALREGREPTSGPRMSPRTQCTSDFTDCIAIPESEINPFPELPMGSPGTASTQIQGSPGPSKNSFQGSPGPTRGSFSSLQRPVVTPPPINPTGFASSSTLSPKPSPAHTPRSSLPGIDTSSRDNLRTTGRTDSFPSSGAWSTVATPGVADEDGKEKKFDLNRPSPPSPSAPPLDQTQEPRSPGDKKNVRFAGPDGAPLSPAHTHMTFDSYDAPTAPPPSTNAYSPTEPSAPNGNGASNSTSSSSDPTNRARGDSTSSSSRTTGTGTGGGNGNGNGNGYNNQHTGAHSIGLPPPPPPSLASAPKIPPPVPQPHGLGLSSPPPSALPVPISTSTVPSAPPTRKQIEQTQKHAKWAISALEFDDIETARAELRKALAMIGG